MGHKLQIKFPENYSIDSVIQIDNGLDVKLTERYTPKDGDFVYLQTKLGFKFIIIIYKDVNLNTTSEKSDIHSYCTSIINCCFILHNDNLNSVCARYHEILFIRKATEEEKKSLLYRLSSEEGYKWNAETKTFEKIDMPKVGDICIAWSYKDRAIIGKLLDVDNHIFTVGGERYEHCIKFESMEQYYEIINS